jgi:hypothetical protein
MRRGAAAAPRTLSHAVAKKKKRHGPGAGGRVRRAGDPPDRAVNPPPPRRDRPPFGALGALGALGSLRLNQCAFQKKEKHTLSLKLSKKQFFVLWTRDSREGKLERENLRFAVQIHLKHLPELEAHTTS